MVISMYYINYFFIMSIFGHLIETILFSKMSSGILFSYWTPIYGVGSIIILFIYNCVHKTKYEDFKKIFILFISSTIILSLTEMTGGYLIKWLLNKDKWDYTDHILNIGKYTSIEMALIWGFCSLIFLYILKPIVDKITTKIPKFVTYMCIILFIIDLIATSILKI